MSEKQTSESFWNRVDVNSLDKCWPWKGSCNNTGYGTVGWYGKVFCAHRLAAWLLGFVEHPEAPIDRTGSGFILHECDNPPCCNPTHWNIGTYTKNQLDAYNRKRRHQPQGHNHLNAKLRPEQVKAIRYAFLEQKHLAKIYNVSQRVISLIRRNETYRNFIC